MTTLTSGQAQYDLSPAQVQQSFKEDQARFFKVPADQRSANPEAYQPYLFSFGLYHSTPRASNSHAASISYDGDRFKKIAKDTLLDDTGFKHLVDQIAGVFDEIWTLYVETHDCHIDANQHHRIALDGITIVASTMAREQPADDVHPQAPLIYPIARMVFRDALLLENQVPIIVLKYAVDNLKVLPAPFSNPSLQDVLQWYCDRASPFPNFKSNAELRLDSTLMIKSLLSYIYSRLTEEPSHASSDHVEGEPSMPTASHLARCGVRFRPCDTAFRGIFFDKKTAVLYIPKIGVSEGTVRFLHNLLAYEATSRFPYQSYVISLAYFMDRLIDTDEDVRVLVEAGVISNKLGSHEKLASMWNNLCNSVSCRTTHPDRAIMKHLEELAKSRCRRWRAALEEKYWEKQPWLLLSVVTAVILLVLTFLQTIYTIRSASPH